MLLIAIDTSGRNGSVALCRGDQNSFEVLQFAALQGGTYSARLMPAITELLDQQHVNKEQVDAFVVVSGPGSFTGLRVGIATVKGLCEVLRKPLSAVSMLEAVALIQGGTSFGSAQGLSPVAAGTSSVSAHGFSRAESDSKNAAFAALGQITVALDAGRGETYVGEFHVENSQTSVMREYIAKLELFAAEAAASRASVLTTDSKVADALSASGASVKQVAAVDAGEIGHIGLLKLLRGEFADPATLDANYIRRSDAEIFAAPKH